MIKKILLVFLFFIILILGYKLVNKNIVVNEAEITFLVDMQNVLNANRNDVLKESINIISKRARSLGYSPQIQTSKTAEEYKIILRLTNVVNLDKVSDIIAKSAELYFWEEGSIESSKSAEALSKLPKGVQGLFSNPSKTKLSGQYLKETKVMFENYSGKPEVELTFTEEGAKLFAELTKRNTNKILIITLDNKIIQTPRVNNSITNGQAVINGNFTTEQARALAIQLNSGALPTPLKVLDKRFTKE